MNKLNAMYQKFLYGRIVEVKKDPLTFKQEIVLYLHDEGMNQTDIGKAMGVKHGTIRNQLYAIRDKGWTVNLGA